MKFVRIRIKRFHNILPGQKTSDQIRLKYRDRLDSAAVDGHLREQLLHGMKKGIRDSLHYMYDNPSVIHSLVEELKQAVRS